MHIINQNQDKNENPELYFSANQQLFCPHGQFQNNYNYAAEIIYKHLSSKVMDWLIYGQIQVDYKWYWLRIKYLTKTFNKNV